MPTSQYGAQAQAQSLAKIFRRACRGTFARRYGVLALIACSVLALLLILLFVLLGHRINSPDFLLAPYPALYEHPPTEAEVGQPQAGIDDARAEIINVGTRVDNMSCAHWASAALSGVRVTTVGFGRETYSNLDKLPLVLEAAAAKKMRDWDVVIYLDQDIVFTGADFQLFIDDFIRRSPAHPSGLNVREIRRGSMVAPLRFASDPGCWAPTTTRSIEGCEKQFNAMEAAVSDSATFNDFEYLWDANISSANGRGPELYLNSGFYMARLWALKELAVAQARFTPELPYRGARHWSDQAIYVSLYLDLRWGELDLGLLAANAHLLDKPKMNQFGLHYGLIDIWRTKPPVMLILGHGIPTVRVDAGLYGLDYATSMFPQVVPPDVAARTVNGILLQVPSVRSYVRNVTLPFRNTKGIQSVRTAPSLFGISPRLVDQTAEGVFVPLYPVALHFADRNKDERLRMYLPFLGWSIAMDLEPGQRERTLDTVRSTVVPVMNNAVDGIQEVDIGTHCAQWITDNLANGPTVY